MVTAIYPFEKSTTKFQFIPVQNPNEAKDRTALRLARSHAVTQGIKNKRKHQQSSGDNFRIVSLENEPGQHANKRKRAKTLVASPCSLLPITNYEPGPLQMFAKESPRLQALLHNHLKIQQYTEEPVFSVSDELVLRNFRQVLRNGLDDHALLSAVMLTFAFTDTAGSIECLGYQNDALRSVRQKMSSPHKAISESTLGAILLLAGIEARLGMPRQVQLHMGAIQQILAICRAKGVYLSDGIKRAIFWSDLNSSVMTGSNRIVGHATFPELQWRRDLYSPKLLILPPGFQSQRHLLDQEFTEVLMDVHALQCIRDSTYFEKEDTMQMANIDNHQASIQSRLVSLPSSSSISECCHLAAYLCSVMLRCRIWRTSTIPSHLSSQLLYKLQESNDDLLWDDRPDLLAWILYLGGAFAPTGTIRSTYETLLRSNRITRLKDLYKSWPELLEILKQFIWSEKAFTSQVKAFWEETST